MYNFSITVLITQTYKTKSITITRYYPANILRKSNVILRLYFGNLRKLLSADVDGT